MNDSLDPWMTETIDGRIDGQIDTNRESMDVWLPIVMDGCFGI